MGNYLKKLLCLMMTVLTLSSFLVGADISANAQTNGAFEYVVLEDKTAQITSYNITGSKVIIPSEIDGYTVTSIGYYAFSSNYENSTEIIIPDSVTSIGDCAFSNCTSLTEVTIPYSVTNLGSSVFSGCDNLKSINVDEKNSVYSSKDGILFNKDKTVLLQYPYGKKQTTFVVPEGVESMDEYAFEWCGSFSHIVLPSSLTSISYEVLRTCLDLVSIDVDKNNAVYSSEDGVLFNKNKTILVQYPNANEKDTYVIPDGVKSIGDNAFVSCNNLKEVIIPNGVTSIGIKAFSCCYNLTNVEIPESVTSISEYAFDWCENLTKIDLPDGLKSLGEGTFMGCKKLTNITIPDGITSIESYLFQHCWELTSVTIPNSVTSIGNFAFSSCPNLTDIYFYGSEKEWKNISIAKENEGLSKVEVHFVTLLEAEDVKTGIIVTENTSETLPYNTKLVVKQLSNTSNSVTYDISLVKGGEGIQPNGKITVKIPVPENLDGNKCKVYRQESNNTYTDMKAEYSEEYMVFTTDHFSTYIITTEDLNISKETVEEDNVTTLPTTETSESNVVTEKTESGTVEENKDNIVTRSSEKESKEDVENISNKNASKLSPNTGIDNYTSIVFGIVIAVGVVIFIFAVRKKVTRLLQY